MWVCISRAWKIMFKGTYQLSPCTLMELLHSNVWLFDGLELINNGFTCSSALDIYYRTNESNVWMIFRIVNTAPFFHGKRPRSSLTSEWWIMRIGSCSPSRSLINGNGFWKKTQRPLMWVNGLGLTVMVLKTQPSWCIAWKIFNKIVYFY